MSWSCLIITCMMSLTFPSQRDAELQLSGIRSPEGQLYVFVYNYSNQFPDSPYRYFQFDKAGLNPSTTSVSLQLDALETGRYAVIVFDDENANGAMDKFLGLPKEGYGFSNNARLRLFSLPKFDDLLIDISSDNPACCIEMRYTL